MNAAHTNPASATPLVAPPSTAPGLSVRRRRRRRPETHRLACTLCIASLAISALVVYVFGCATATTYNRRQAQLQKDLRVLRNERELLEAQVADLQRLDRVLFLAKQQGMQPRDALQYVALTPPPEPRVIRQASARP